MRIFGLILLGLLAFAITAIWKFPAAGVLPYVNTHPVVVNGVGGTLWNGSARQVSTQPDLDPITNVKWRFAPQTLIDAAAGYNLTFDWLDGDGQAQVARDMAGNINISDGIVRMPAKSLQQFLPLPVATFDGILNADIDFIKLVNSRLQTTAATLNWRSAKINGAVNANLGNVELAITPDNDLHRGKLSNANGELEIDGDFQIDQAGTFLIDVRFKPLSNTPPELTGMLGAIGKRASDGSFRVRNNGNISDFL